MHDALPTTAPATRDVASPEEVAPLADDEAHTPSPLANEAAVGTPLEIAAPAGAAAPPDDGGYRADIDGLRAAAVAAVVAFHIDEAAYPAGFAGVGGSSSSPAVAASVDRKLRKDRDVRAFLGEFYARRVGRLAPALAVATARGALRRRRRRARLGEYFNTGLLGLVGGANVFLLSVAERDEKREVEATGGVTDDAGGYFTSYGDADRAPHRLDRNPFMHTWSLGVEEQFYVIFPLIAFASRGRFWPLLVLVVASAAYAATADASMAFYLMPARFWELGAGALAWHALESPRYRRDALRASTAGAVVGGRGPAARPRRRAFATGARLALPGACLAVAGSAAFLAAGAAGRRGAAVRASRCARLGKLSYGIYLWHWPILTICRYADAPIAAAACACAFGSLPAAAASYATLERAVSGSKPEDEPEIAAGVRFGSYQARSERDPASRGRDASRLTGTRS
ncbi:transferase [Aureococcus anophagefferens]|nr:transferase [Aureococcus anophagefferens]